MKHAHLALVLAALAPLASAQLSGLGKIDFPNSGAKEAQAAFLQGALLLHSFEYEDAAEAFQEAQRLDPGFALAYWGEALTHCHPIWHEEDRDAARTALAKLAPSVEERARKAPTEREKGLLAAVETLFGEGERPARLRAYSDSMQKLHRRFPSDLEIAAFYSLSLLGTATSGRDIPTYMRAAAVAEEILAASPDHPGALHYAIHSYDDPVHAPLGLRMARRYGAVAPAADHALHMPSHIYVALGMWEESAAANEASSAAADARRARKTLSLEARGYHSLYWLCYTYLQLGRFEEARKLLADMVRDARESGSKRTRSTLALMRATLVIATGDWKGDEARRDIDREGLERATVAADLFVQGFGALERGDRAGAEAALSSMRERRAALEAEVLPGATQADCCGPASLASYAPARQAVIVIEEELAGALALAKGDTEQGLFLLKRAADDEDAMGFDFGPPVVVKPAHELLGEVLLELGRHEEARKAFQAALRRAPGRSLSLLGQARAAAAAGDRELARASYADLARNWHRADADLAGLEEVRAGAGGPDR